MHTSLKKAAAATLSGVLALALVCPAAGAAGVAYAEEATNASSAASHSASKSGSWTYQTVTKKGKKSQVKDAYRYSDGSYPSGVQAVDGKLYYFTSTSGKLAKSSKAQRLVAYQGSTYDVAAGGAVKTGWQVVDKKLMFFDAGTGAARCSTSVDGIALNGQGVAKESLDATLRTKCILALEKITNREASKATQLLAAWNWLTNRKIFKYWGKMPDFKNKSWSKLYALEMLTKKKGNCYGYASTFSALAYTIGYNPKVVWGKVYYRAGGRGYTHGMVQIDGRWYDPQAQASKRILGIYNSKTHHRKGIRDKKTKYFRDFHGTKTVEYYQGKTKKKATKKKTAKRAKLRVVKKGSSYVGYKGSKKLKGVYKIGGKLYKFNSKGKQSVSSAKKLWSLSAEDKRWSKLRAVLGKPLSSQTLDGCQGGKDVIHKYAHVEVTVFVPDNKGPQTIEDVSAR